MVLGKYANGNIDKQFYFYYIHTNIQHCWMSRKDKLMPKPIHLMDKCTVLSTGRKYRHIINAIQHQCHQQTIIALPFLPQRSCSILLALVTGNSITSNSLVSNQQQIKQQLNVRINTGWQQRYSIPVSRGRTHSRYSHLCQLLLLAVQEYNL